MKTKATKENKVYKYFLVGLTAKEIGKLTDLSERTVQRIIKAGNFKESIEPQPIASKACDLRKKGLTYVQIAKALKCSKTSVYNYLKQYRASNQIERVQTK